MNGIFDTYRPEGFQTINSYLMVENPDALITFLKNVFYADELNRTINPSNGEIANCILKIGTSCFMISQARGQFIGMRTSHYLYVKDVDAIHQLALGNGAKEEFAPANMPYGDRQSGIVDPSGSYWWISTRLEEKTTSLLIKLIKYLSWI